MNLHEAENLAKWLIHQHAPPGWRFGWNRRKRAFGVCNYQHKRISLSVYLTQTEPPASVRNTIIHEIAHAITPGNGHGAAWRDQCLAMGGVPKRKMKPVSCPPYKYVLKFGDEIIRGYYRKPRRDFSAAWLAGRRNETYGKLQLSQVQ